MDQVRIDQLLADGHITQVEHDQMTLELTRKLAMQDEEEAKKRWLEDIKNASPTTQKTMCKQKGNYMNILGALEEDNFDRKELQKKANRLIYAIRGSSSSAF